MNEVVDEALITVVADVLRNAPEWLRHDLASRESSARLRAEETLAAMIAAALADDSDLKVVPTTMQPNVTDGRSKASTIR